MKKTGRYFCSFAATLVAAIAWGQGSAAGYGQKSAGQYGQGGGGGGFGGRMGSGLAGNGSLNRFNMAGSTEPDQGSQAKPDYDQTPGFWTARHAVLTPGDRVEYKLKMKAGQTIFAGASSDAFDPALEFDDPKGVKLISNDDRVQGDQEPFLIYRVTADGEYTLKVLSYRSVSGGSFDVRFRTFKATDAGFDSEIHADLSPVHTESGGDRFDFRITAHKGKFYDLSFLNNGAGRRNLGFSFDRIVGPTGVEDSDFKAIPTPDQSQVFLAKADGDYYVEYTIYDSELKKIGTDYRELTAAVVKSADSQEYPLAAYQMQIVEFPVRPNEIVRTAISGMGVTSTISAPPSEEQQPNSPNDPGFGNTNTWSWYKMNVDSDDDVVRVFHGTGDAIMAIRSNWDKDQKVKFVNEDKLPDWAEAQATKGSIEIGDARLYTLHSTHSELMEVSAEAANFQVKMEIFRLNGELANTLMQRRSHKVGDNLYFPDEDTFLVRISCDGNGGSGDYSIKRDTYSPTPYALAQTKSLALHGNDFGLYSMNLEKGKRYELITDQYIGTDVLDDNGDFLTTQPVNLGSVIVQYFVPAKSGVHRLWLRGQTGTYKFRLEANVPPSLGS